MTTRPPPRLAAQLTALTLGRLLINTGLRLTYPFLPELARGLGVSLTAVSQLVTIRNLFGLLSPLFGPLSDRFGRRPILVASMILFGLGCLVVVVWPAYWGLGVTLSLISLAKVIYDPAMQAHLGDTVPYASRGRVLAVTELSWAGALLVGAPAVGFVIQRQGWTAPFLWLALLGLGMLFSLYRAIPDDGPAASRIGRLADIVRVIRRERVIWAAAVYIVLLMAANELILIVYGGWMERTFDLDLTNLGLAAGVIGGAEIIGELTAGWSVDLFGKRPVIITTAVLTALLYGLVPLTAVGLPLALGGLFALFLAFEITVVGGIPLMTEIVPSARGVVLSVVLAAGALGRGLGSFFGPRIWERGGLEWNGITAALLMVVATVILARWIREV